MLDIDGALCISALMCYLLHFRRNIYIYRKSVAIKCVVKCYALLICK